MREFEDDEQKKKKSLVDKAADVAKDKAKEKLKETAKDSIKEGLNDKLGKGPSSSQDTPRPEQAGSTAPTNVSSDAGKITDGANKSGLAGAKSSAGAASSGATAAGTGAGSGAAAGAAAGSGAAAGGSIAAGAAAGSVVPGIGTVAGAAAAAAKKVVGNNAKDKAKQKAVSETSKEAEVKTAGKKGKKKKKNSSDNTLLIIMLAIFGIILAVVIFIVIILVLVLLVIAAPFIIIFIGICAGAQWASELFDNTVEVSYDTVVEFTITGIKECLTTAYEDTCYQEIVQICNEKGWNLDMTLESYNRTEFPYVLEGDDCNVNYTEIFCVISMSEKEGLNSETFDYQTYNEFIHSTAFLRSLYELKIDEVNYLTLDLEEGWTGEVSESGYVHLMNYNTNSGYGYQGEKGVDYDTYGEVQVSRYSLKKLFDAVGVDPYAYNTNVTTYTNLEYLDYSEETTRAYDDTLDYGSTERSQMFDYELYTGEILSDGSINMYSRDYIDYLALSSPGEPMAIPLYLQGDERWKYDIDGSEVYMNDGSTIKKAGCCVTSMAMVCTYLTGVETTPVDLVKCRITTTRGTDSKIYGPINRGVVAADYGFSEKNYGKPSSSLIATMCEELDAQHPLILKFNTAIYKNKSYNVNNPPTHFIVLTGYSAEEECFYVNDPAGTSYFGEGSKYNGKLPMSLVASSNMFMEVRAYGIWD